MVVDVLFVGDVWWLMYYFVGDVWCLMYYL